MPSKWMIGGKSVLKTFRTEMMNDTHISKLFDYEDSGYVFTGQHIDGGICYLLWDNNHDEMLDYKYISENNDILQTKRYLNDSGTDIVIRDSRRTGIINKVESSSNFSLIVSARKPFGINTDLFNNPDAYPEFNLSDNEFDDSVFVWGVKGIKGGAKRISGYKTGDNL